MHPEEVEHRRRSTLARLTLGAVAAVVAVLVPTGPAPRAEERPWVGPPAEFVSDLGDHEHKYTYNTQSAVSGDGRKVVFVNHIKDRPQRLFLRNMARDHAKLLLKRPPAFERKGIFGGEFSSPGLNEDGRYLTFATDYAYVSEDDNRHLDVYRYDLSTKAIELVSVGANGPGARASFSPNMSPDGRFIAFRSRAKNLVEGDTNKSDDIFVRDMVADTTVRASVADDESQSEPTPNPDHGYGAWADSYKPSISADGSMVAFVSYAANLVDGDTNEAADAFVRDLEAGTTVRVSVTSSGEQLVPFEYEESASYFRDGVFDLVLSADASMVVFTSHANGLVPEDDNNNVDVFAHLMATRETIRVSVTNEGEDAYGDEYKECGSNGQCFGFIMSHSPSVSADGRYIAFISGAPKLDEDPADTEEQDEDYYVHDFETRVTRNVIRSSTGEQIRNSNPWPGHITSDGRLITYATDGRRISPEDNAGGDVFLQQLDPVNFEREG